MLKNDSKCSNKNLTYESKLRFIDEKIFPAPCSKYSTEMIK